MTLPMRLHLGVFALVGLSLAAVFTSGCNRDPNLRKQKYLESGQRYEKNGKLREAAIQFSNALKVDRNFAQAHFELGKVFIQMGTMISASNELALAVDLDPANLPARIQLGNMRLAGGMPDEAMQEANAVLAVAPNNADAYALASSISAEQGDRASAERHIHQALALEPNRTEFYTTYALIESSKPDGGPVAENALRKALSLDPKNVTAHLILAALLENKGDHAGAENQTREAILLSPGDLQARRNLAGLYLRSGKRFEAEETLRVAAEDLSNMPEGAQVLSDFYLGEGKVAQAERAYADLVQKHPQSNNLKYAYARILIVSHRDDEATQILQQLSSQDRDANNAQVQILTAGLLLNKGKTAEAFDLLRKAVRLAPDNLDLQLTLGKVSLQKRDFKTAEYSFHQASRLAPGNLEVESGLAEAADSRQDYAQLAQIAESTLTRNPQYPDAYVWRGTAEANTGRKQLAERDFQAALSKDPANVAALAELGQLRMREQRVPEGFALINQALKIDPNSAVVLNMLVQYYVGQNRPDQAVLRIRQQLDLQPGNADLLNQLAEVQAGSGNLKEARSTARLAMETEPDNLRAVQNYSGALAGLGDKEGAVTNWNDWLARHPDDAIATSMLAEIEEERGNCLRAEDLYRKALQLDPHQVLASNNLAYLMVENNENLDVALALAQDARNGSHGMPGTADTLAWVLYRKGQYGSARDLLEEAVKTDPANAEAHYHLGMTYAKLGQQGLATQHLRKAAALAPKAAARRNAGPVHPA